MIMDHFIMNASKLRFPIFSISNVRLSAFSYHLFSSIHPYLTSHPLFYIISLLLLCSFFFLFFSLSIRLTRKIRLRQIRISRQNKRFNLRQSIQRIIAESQMILDRLLGRQSQPLRNGNVVVDG